MESIAPEHILQFIAHRRTTKPEHFTGDPVPEASLVRMLEAANWAPTHGFTEPWRFTVFTGEGIETLLDFYGRLDQGGTINNEVRYAKLRDRFTRCSHIVAISMQRGSNPKIPELEELEAVSCAVQNFWLQAAAEGCGGYWSTGEIAHLHNQEWMEFLGPQAGSTFLGLFLLGVPEAPLREGRRLSTALDKTTWVRE